MKKLFEEVYELFNISKEAFNLFYTLKYTTQGVVNSKDVLCLCKDRREADKVLKELSKKLDRKSRNVFESKEEKIYVKTIEECKSGLDGYRFSTIVFCKID